MATPTKVLSRVRTIEGHGEGVYTVTFDVPARHTRYSPGQFLHLTLEAFDPTNGYWPESRVFSIASPPRQEFLTIVYSVKGVYTQRMERELVVGREVWLKLPYGDFIIDETLGAQGPIILIGGGTGVSPYRPFLLGDRTGTAPIHLFYGVRKPEHLLFGDDWTSLAKEPWFHLHLLVEAGAVPNLGSIQGRLSIPWIAETLGPQFPSGHFFLSGPPAMIRAFHADLKDRGIGENQVHIDEWE